MIKQKGKPTKIAEAIIEGAFVVVAAMSSLSLLGYINVSENAQTVIAYALGAFASVVFGWIVWKSVQN